MKKIFILHLFLACFVVSSYSQATFPNNGVKTEKENYYALTNAVIYTDYKTRLANATIVIRNGIIENVGVNIPVPKGAIVKDMNGYQIYPAFIDLYSNYGIKAPEPIKKNYPGPQFLSNKTGAYSWNQAVHPETNASDYFVKDESKADRYRKMGFGITLSHLQDGVFRGTGALVMTGNEAENQMIINPFACTGLSFNKGTSTQDYPSSLMGSIALIRQTFYDARWYAGGGNKQEANISLNTLNTQLSLPMIFDARDVLNVLRADKIGKEFSMTFIIKGAGDEYQRADEIKKAGVPLIIPINFPLAYDVSDVEDAQLIPLKNLKHWELAPYNPRILWQKGITFCITSDGTDKEDDFWKNLKLMVKDSLPVEEALKALTVTPAKLLKIDNLCGTLEKGKLANFIVCSGYIFANETKVLNTWIKGREYFENAPLPTVTQGRYNLSIDKAGTYTIEIEYGNDGAIKSTIIAPDSSKIPATVVFNNPAISITSNLVKDGKTIYFLSGFKDGDTFKGTGTFNNKSEVSWSATLKSPRPLVDSTMNNKPVPVPSFTYPFAPYGWDTIPTAHNVLFKNATVWTNEKDGILPNTDVLIRNGKIAQVGKNISAPGAEVIDLTGKALTSGIIDEHSHIAASQGVNEGAQSATSEVRIADIINSEDVNIYRQLGGGVTCSHILHGSANCIGGQTQLIKLRWGYAPEALKFAGWPGFIKFALGENVKQSNWGDQQTSRFPQTRMGVEQEFFYMFSRAKEYDASWKKYNGLSAKLKPIAIAPRRDLKLEALAEILNRQRFITCHSYQQSEINMLIHVADSFGFKVNTFTHILEGYKVADKMKAHGANASTFSDWWAYKFEVIDAIPYNGAIMHSLGLNVSFNSDDAEMARRLNQEAGKAVMYGGVTEEEAWKFVTLNPAIMLHIDDKVGSIKAGKDADIVVWSGNPLSIYSKCERTYVDGICFYSMERDLKCRENIQQEKNRLLQLMAEAKKKGTPTQPFKIEFKQLYTCDTDGDFVK